MNHDGRALRMELADGRVRLRRYLAEDVPAVWAAIEESRRELELWMPWCVPDYSYEDCEANCARLQEKWLRDEVYAFLITVADTGMVVGTCGLNAMDRVNLRANLGYWVRTGRIGEGLATAAAGLLARFGFEDLGLARLEIVVAVENEVSQRVAEKLGATRECVLRSRLRLQGVMRDAVSFSLTRRNETPNQTSSISSS